MKPNTELTDDKKSGKTPEATPDATAAVPDAPVVRNLDIKPPQVRNLDQPVSQAGKAKASAVKVFSRDGTTREVKRK